MQRRSIPSTEQTTQQKLLRLAQIVVGAVLTILYALLLLSWGVEFGDQFFNFFAGEWIGAIIFALVGIPLGILLFRKILFPFFVRIKK